MSNLSFLTTYSLLFASFLVATCLLGSHGNKVILDISGITDKQEPAKVLSSSVIWFHENNPHIGKSNPVHLYFEIRSRNGAYDQVDKLLNAVRNFSFKVKLLINIRLTDAAISDAKKHIETEYSDLLSLLNKESSLIAGLSFYPTNLKQACIKDSGSPYIRMRGSNIVEEAKRFLQSLNSGNPANTLPEIGYTLDHDSFYCNRHNHYKRQADYLIINFDLRSNDKLFVESFSIFKENMEMELSEATKHLQELNEKSTLMYIKVSVTVKLDADHKEVKQCSHTSPQHKSIAKQAITKLYDTEKTITKSYEALLTQFCCEWIANKSPTPVIIKYNGEWRPTIKTKNNRPSRVIPHIASLPEDVTNKHFTSSTSNLLEEMASSGFDTVMINGDTWQKLVQSGMPKPDCARSPCNPHNIWYLNNINNSFSMYNEIQELLEAGGMRLTNLVFSSYYSESKQYSWESTVKTAKNAGGTSSSLNTTCIKRGNFFDLIHKQSSRFVCSALELQKLPKCHSLRFSSDSIVWKGELTVKHYDLDSFVDKTMKKLDALVIARQMLHISYPDKQVILRIKVIYEGEGNTVIRNPIYCTKLRENVFRIYEMLLTWAQSHDFPIILEKVSGYNGNNNPLVWKQMSTLSSGRMQKLMEAFPIFIRRSYNQSTVFGSWTKGMYPCIQQSQENERMKEINFYHEFTGVTLRMDLRNDGTPIRSAELHTLLLFALRSFNAVDISVLAKHQLKTLLETVSKNDFADSLKRNQIGARKVYIEISMEVHKNDKELMNGLISQLQNHGFKVHIHVTRPINISEIMNYDRSDGQGEISVGIIYDNCTNAAFDALSHGKDNGNINKMQHLICETKSIPAKNTDKVVMQDYLESHLYLKKLFQYFYPNLKEINFRLHTTRVGANSHEESLNLLLFLADVNKFARAYDIHYFLAPVIPSEYYVQKGESSFWTVSDYKNLIDVSVFLGNLEGFLNPSNWIPIIAKKDIETVINIDTTSSSSSHIQPPVPSSTLPSSVSSTSTPMSSPTLSKSVASSNGNDVTGMGVNDTTKKPIESEPTPEMYIILIGVAFMVVVSVFLLIFIKMRRNRRYLSVKEVNDFFNGHWETLEEAAKRRKRNTVHAFNVFDGLVYQRDYETPKKDIKLKDLIKNGKFSKVYQAILEGWDKSCIVEVGSNSCSREMFRVLLSEAKMLCYVGSHVNIVKFIGCYTKEIRKGILWIVSEYCEGGTLIEYLKKSKEEGKKKQISVNEMIRFAKEIACGMEFLSNQNVVHGDLRAKHVYLDQHKVCKVGNFGLSRKLLKFQILAKKKKRGLLPWRWMSLETLHNMELSNQSDVWSYGVTIWEVFALGEVPYDVTTYSQDFMVGLENGKRLVSPIHATSDIYDMMQRCWTLDQENRPTFKELIKQFLEMLPSNETTTHSS